MAKAGKSGVGKSGTGSPGKKTKAKTAAPKGGGAAKKASPRKTAARKTPAPTRTGKGKGRERTAGRIIPHTATTLLVLVGFFIMAAAGAYILLYPESSVSPLNPASSSSRPSPPVATKTSKTAKPHYEVFPVEPVPTRKTPPVHRQPVAAGKSLPLVAIIIDDIGHDRKIAEKFFTLNAPLTYAVLPHSRFCREIAVLAARKGYEVMLHLPMEPNEYPLVDPGPGALLAAMTPDERIDQLKRNIDAVPHVKGVNNHMGSKMTTLSDEMNQVFGILKQRGLFFVDSRTTAATQTRSSAKLFKVPYAERDVFLDHVQKKDAIRRQIDHLVNIAEIHGKAVAIGHPHHMTYEVLAEALPDLKQRVKLVPASEIVEVF